MQRPSVDLPQPDSPTRPSASPARELEVDAVDGAQHLRLSRAQPSNDAAAEREVHREAAHLEQRLRHSAITGSRRDVRGAELVMDAGASPGRRRARRSGNSPLDAVGLRERAARVEAAARRRRGEVGRRAGDRREPSRGRRRRRAPSAAGRACTGGAARGTPRRPARSRPPGPRTSRRRAGRSGRSPRGRGRRRRR